MLDRKRNQVKRNLIFSESIFFHTKAAGRPKPLEGTPLIIRKIEVNAQYLSFYLAIARAQHHHNQGDLQ